MPPELILILVGIATAAGAGVQQLIKAVVKRQVAKMQEDDAEALKDREAQRQREREVDQQARLRLEAELEKAKADASEAKATGENLTNLTAAFLKSVDTYSKEQFANREALSNNTQTIGDLEQSVDRVGSILSENTSATRAVGAKMEAAVAAIEHLEAIMNTGVHEIKLLLAPPPPQPPLNVVTVNTGAAVEKPASDTAEDEEAA